MPGFDAMLGVGLWWYAVVFVFLVSLAVAWILLPFALFGIRARLETMIEAGKKFDRVFLDLGHINDIGRQVLRVCEETKTRTDHLVARAEAADTEARRNMERAIAALEAAAYEVKKTNLILQTVHNIKFEE